jgi:hypothetical protein
MVALHEAALSDIDWPFDKGSEFVLHIAILKVTPIRSRFEGDEDIDIAIGAEIVAEDGAEDAQLGDLPSLTEGGEFVRIDDEMTGLHGLV